MIKKTLKEHSPQLRLLLLGAPQLKINETPVRLPYLKAEALLYYLAVTGRPHSRANLAALLWSKSTEHQARNSLRNAIYTIRQGLKPAHVVVVERDTISLNMAGIELDVIYFQTIVKEHPANTAALSAALALWRSAFLDGLHLPDAPVFDEWIAEQRTHYDALYRQGLFYLGQLLAAEKRWLEAQQTIETLLAVDPLHEAGYQQLMRIHMQMGNRAAALNRYETLRTLLVEQLGVDPDPASQALHLELLQADGVPSSKNLMVGLPAKLSRQYKFVGRERELDLLTQYYQNILPSGAARLIMIEGEPGIGKTRLAKEWLATLTRTGILTTRCFEAEQVIPFQPWIDLIRTTLKQIPVPQLGLPDIWLIELAHLVPEIRLQRPDLEPSQITDPELARGRIIQAVYHWLEAMCRYQPLCILIDDWQWLDQASFTLLRYILRPQQSNRLPLLILGTQLEAQPMLGWSKFRTVLEREDILHHIKLRRLSLAELTRLAA